MMKLRIIGVSGTNGSGKDTLAIMMAARHGFLNASATEMFLEELQARGLPPNREHKSALSAEWRRELGMGAIVDKAVEMFNASPGKYKGIVVGSLRHPGEADRVHELGGKVVWIDADERVRYDRIQKNIHERLGTHVEHDKTFEEFQAEQEREMHHTGDAATLNISGVKDRADIFLMNDRDDIEAFQDAAEAELIKQGFIA